MEAAEIGVETAGDAYAAAERQRRLSHAVDTR